MPRYEIDVNKTYLFPEEIQVVEFEQSILVISPKFANWIVLESSEQYDVFVHLREGHSIQDALDCGLFDQADVRYVVTQIEARRLWEYKCCRCSPMNSNSRNPQSC